MFGGGPPVFSHCSIWPSMSVSMPPSIRLASALRSAGTPLGMAQPQTSFQAIGVSRRQPMGKRAMPTWPAIFDFFGSLKPP